MEVLIMDRNKIEEKLSNLYIKLSKLKKTFIGYPCDAELDYSCLYKFLEFPINNVGDPFELASYRLQTKDFEIEVLRFFAKLFHIDKYWGYVTNGGTEGNLYGLYVARELLPKANVFFSEHTHYSIRKNVHLLNMQYEIIKSQKNGEIDYADFSKKLQDKKQAIIVANIGSTITGAIDNIEKISNILKQKKIKYYIHADAALYGMVLPFCSSAVKFDFQTNINSIAVSGHKFIGSPIPCGIVLAREEVVDNVQSYIEYIDSHDSTLSGSRDAFTPLLLWYRINTIGLNGFRKQVTYSNKLANYLVSELKRINWLNIGQSYITVRFKKPSDKLIKKWELAVQDDMAHIICLPHETKEQLHKFINELEKEKNDSAC
jgi:histidine decarboxylase